MNQSFAVTLLLALSMMRATSANADCVECEQSQVHITIGGDGKEHQFVRDQSYPELGEAYRDERGLIWGDLVKKANGDREAKTWLQAKEYCLNLNPESERARIKADIEADREPNSGIFLPLRSDFVHLRGDLGAKDPERSEKGYRAQPSIANLESDSWSSSPGCRYNAFQFSGYYGRLDPPMPCVRDYHYYDDSFRCVAH